MCWKQWEQIPDRSSALKVDGGASANNFLMQTQADISRRRCTAEVCGDDCMGAAYLAGLAVGYWKDKEDVNRTGTLTGCSSQTLKSKNSRKCSKDGKKLCSTHMDGQKKSYHRKLSVISKNTCQYRKKRYIVIVTE